MIKQVTTLTTSAAAVILTPGRWCHNWTIQNTGSNAVSLSWDGFPSNANAASGAPGYSTPTATVGYLLNPSAQVSQTFTGSKNPPVVVGIMVAGTTTLNITTDDQLSV